MKRWSRRCGIDPAAGAAASRDSCRSPMAPTARPARAPTMVVRVLRETALTVAPHLTCIGAAARGGPRDRRRSTGAHGIRHMVALRGDAPAGAGRRVRAVPAAASPMPSDLVRGLSRCADFEISVAAYPEGHPETPAVEADLANLQAQARRRREPRHHAVLLRYRRVTCATAIAAPRPASRATIVPGILPITRFPQMLRFAARCGAACRTGCGGASTDSTRMRTRAA